MNEISRATQTSRQEPKPTGAGATTRLLHVEDDETDALLFQEQIRGVVPAVEFNTVARVADLTEDSIAADCAILDLSLPGAGLEALLKLRELSEDLPIIVLASIDDIDLAVEALRLGADDYLVKSEVGGATLRRGIRYAIERRRLRKDLMAQATTAAIATAQTIMAAASLQVAHAKTVTAEAALEVANAETALAQAALIIANAETVSAETALEVANAETVSAETALEVAQADTQTAEAALELTVADGAGSDADTQRSSMLRAQSLLATATHTVAVLVDDDTGDYAVRCASCNWETSHGLQTLDIWRERKLDAAILDHVDFGEVFAPIHELTPPSAVTKTAAASTGGSAAIYGPVALSVTPMRVCNGNGVSGGVHQ